MRLYTHMRLWLIILAGMLALIGLDGIAAPPTPARAAGPWYVAPSGSDANSCLSAGSPCATINGAIGKTSSGDTVYVATGVYTASTGSEVVLINKSVTLSGGWNGGFTTQSAMTTINGQGVRRGLTVNGGVIATVDRFMIQGGNFAGDGGGIYIVYGASLTVNSSTITNNTATGSGGGIYSEGMLTSNGTIITNNAASAGGGGGIYNWGSMTLSYSTLSNNMARDGGGIYNTGTSATMTVNNSTVRGNRAVNGWGGGISDDSMTSTLNNTTISSNTADLGGGGINGIGGNLILNNSTVTSNSVTNGGGGGVWGSVTLRNSIVALNTAGGWLGPDCNGTISSAGYNIVGDNSGCIFTPGAGDLTNVNPNIGSLQNNGGSTPTHALLSGSPAIDAGNPVGCMGSAGLLTADQRGLTRFGRCDIGAYEEQAIKSVNNSLISPGAPGTYTISFHNGGTSPYTSTQVTDTLPTSVTYTNNSLTATSGSYGYNSGVITWTGSVNAGSSVTITFGMTVGQVPQVITNSAVINVAGEIITRTAITQVDFYHVYLPLIRRPRRGISGQVSLNGAPAAGVSLELRFFNGSFFSTLATTNTGADGGYEFMGIPSLAPGQIYYVRYLNYANTPGRLWIWGTRALTAYAAGSDITIGNFDIANIALVAPAAGATVALPYTFQWIRRPATPSDSYEFDLYDPTDGDPYAYISALGYVNGLTLTGLPSGFGPGTQYIWEIWVYSPDGGYGISYESRAVTFSNAGMRAARASQLTQLKPAPVREDIPKR